MSAPEPKARFISQYINFISDLGEKVRSDAWWATWTASKDVHLSPLNRVFEKAFLGEKVSSMTMGAFSCRLAKNSYQALKGTAKYLLQIRQARKDTKGQLGELRRRLLGKRVYLIKTFALENSASQGGVLAEVPFTFKDTYFPGLATDLRQKAAVEVLTVFDPVIPVQDLRKGIPNALPIHAFLRKRDFIRAWARILGGALVSFPKDLRFQGQGVGRIVRQNYILDLFSRGTFHHFCIYFAFERLVREFDLSHVAMTCEFHPWERMAILATRRNSPSTRILGYQHSVAYEAALGMFPGENETRFAPFPDQVFTVGEITAGVLRKYGHYETTPVRLAGALRYDYLRALKPRGGFPVERRLLVALNGTPQSIELLDYLCSQMDSLRGWKIVVREHPALRLKDLEFLKGDSYRLDSYPNLEISSETKVIEDLQRSSTVLYHASTVCLEALQLGIPIIHFNDGRLLSSDPAKECNALRWEVSTTQHLVPVLEKILLLSSDVLISETAKARQFIGRYFHPVNEDTFALFLDQKE